MSCRNVAVIAVAWIQIFAQSSYAQNDLVPDKSESIRQSLSQVVLDDKAPGIVAAIISSKGVIASGAAGVRRAGSDRLLTTSDSLALGSCGKAMTSAMLASLVAEGKLSWNMTLTEAIPELKQHVHEDYKQVTLWQLLTHRAGVEDCWTYDQQLTKEKRLALVKERLASPPDYKQGDFHYSNLGYVTAACMAEQVTGDLWETLMEERLFHPLGMTSAGFGVPSTQGQIDQPWGHRKNGSSWSASQSDCSEALGPAGRVYCSMDDWAAFLSLFLNSQNPFLDAMTMAKLVEPTGYYAGGWGVSQDHPWAKGKTISHCGSNGMWYSSVVVAPELDRAYVVVTNSRDFGVTEDVCREVVNSLIRNDLNLKKSSDN